MSKPGPDGGGGETSRPQHLQSQEGILTLQGFTAAESPGVSDQVKREYLQNKSKPLPVATGSVSSYSQELSRAGDAVLSREDLHGSGASGSSGGVSP